MVADGLHQSGLAFGAGFDGFDVFFVSGLVDLIVEGVPIVALEMGFVFIIGDDVILFEGFVFVPSVVGFACFLFTWTGFGFLRHAEFSCDGG